MKQPEQSYTAIETADGFLFFTHTAEGRQTCGNSCSLWRTITLIPISTSVPSMFTGRKHPPTGAVCQSGREPVH